MRASRSHVAKGPSLGLATFAVLGALSWCKPGLAEELHTVGEPRMLSEPAEITQVVDAFDESDPFDLDLTIGYGFSRNTGKILRETNLAGPEYSSGGYTRGTLKVAKYRETTNRLLTRAAVGLYRDLALIIRMPIILSNDRRLDSYDGSASDARVTEGAPGEQLFSVPFRSPTRSGIEYLALGVDYGILNQYRERSNPTWIVGLETRLNVSEPMHACNPNSASGQVTCADPGDVNRNGRFDASNVDSTGTIPIENSSIKSRSEGVSRGVTGLELHTYLSKRIKYIEPYGGLRMLAEFPTGSSDYGLTDLQYSLVNHPPLLGTMTIGMAVIPWEIRDQFQRATIDFRFESSYRSEGRDYSELFDALGSSPAPSLRSPTWAEYHAGTNGTSVIDPTSQRVYFAGLTDIESHIINRASVEVTWQAARYVKFALGTALTVVQSHIITFDQACNANFKNDISEAGPCRKWTGDTSNGQPVYEVTGVPNPGYREVINAVGRRYRVDDSLGFDGWANATVMF